jgi:hypothetical protein
VKDEHKKVMETITLSLIIIFMIELVMVLMITLTNQMHQVLLSDPPLSASTACVYTTTGTYWPHIQTQYVCNLNTTPNIWCIAGNGANLPFIPVPPPPPNCTASQSRWINTSNTTFTIND